MSNKIDNKTQKLRQEFRKAIKDNSHNLPGGYGWYLDENKTINQFLRACAEADMAFVDKDAVMPTTKIFNLPALNAYKCGWDSAQKMIRDADWQKTEKIEVSETSCNRR